VTQHLRTAILVVGLLGAAGAAGAAPAQVTLRGRVVTAETGEPLPFTIVSLIPGSAARFSDAAGAFAITGLPPGSYRLLVRQIGYFPFDTLLALGGDSVVTVAVVLRHLAVELPVITVTAVLCERPGPPDGGETPALAAVFDQLAENARRFALLADSRPFRFQLERKYRSVTTAGTQFSEVDTIEQVSAEERRAYRPGRIVEFGGVGRYRTEGMVRLPGVAYFADSAFVYNHCFSLAGRDTVEGETFIRVDFEPSVAIRSTDVAGAAYLDSTTFQIRYTRVALTRPERVMRDVVALVATTRFREITPGIVLHDRVRAVTTLKRSRARSALVERTEEQRLLAVHFLRPL
jgi:hypothetical protein